MTKLIVFKCMSSKAHLFQTKYRIKMEQNKEFSEKSDQNPMLIVMDDLIKSIQQLQKIIIAQNTPSANTDLMKENKIQELNKSQNSQAAILLHQVQSAMEATISQLSSNNRIFNEDITPIQLTNVEPKEKLSTSEKWRMYTEMIQLKNESSKEYCIMKMRLGQELGLSFKETKREMLIGLWNNRLCLVLYLKAHLNEEDILNDIEEWEKIEIARNAMIKNYRKTNK